MGDIDDIKVDGGKKSTNKGGFFPHETPRPQYPGWSEFFKYSLMHYTRAPLIGAVVTKLVFPRYLRVVAALRTRGWSDAGIFALVASLVHAGTFTVSNFFFYVLGDKLGLLQRFKIDVGTKGQKPTPALEAEALKEMFASLFLIGPLVTYLGYDKIKALGPMMELTAKLPSLATLTAQFAVATAFNDFFFYWVHRLVHSSALYKTIHKKHHKFIESRGIAAEFAHPVEGALANVGPSVGGMLLFHRHPLAFFVWLGSRLQETYEGHSNYYLGDTWLAKIGLTNSVSTAFHSQHHASFNKGNFGSWHMDYLFGTMDAWVAQGGLQGYLKDRLHKTDDKTD